MAEINLLTREYVLKNVGPILTLERGWKEVGVEPWNSEGLLRELPLKWNLSHVALTDDSIIGYCICSSRLEAVYVHKILVDKAARRQGIGMDLLRHSLQKGLEEGIERTMWRVRTENLKAVEWYDGLGFKRSGELDRTRPDGVYYVYDTRIRDVLQNLIRPAHDGGQTSY